MYVEPGDSDKINISKKIKGSKTSNGKKRKGKEKSPMRKKENQYTSLDVFLYTVFTAGLPGDERN
jgi:hypothetical protein